LTRVSAILNHPHKEAIDKLLNSGMKVSEILRHFRQQGIVLSRSALYRYRNSHFVSRRIPNNRLYKILIETGNYNLLKALEKTQQIYETKRSCRCEHVKPEHLKRKGRVFIHIVCNGWFPYDLGIHLKRSHKIR
jgi:hypothetical protein